MADNTLQDLLKIDTSEFATAPYNVTTDRQETQKAKLLSDTLRATTINDKWKTPAIDALTTINEDKPGFVENLLWATGTSAIDAVADIPAGMTIAAAEDPLGFALTAAGAKVGIETAKQAGKGFIRQAISGVAGSTGAGAIISILSPTPAEAPAPEADRTVILKKQKEQNTPKNIENELNQIKKDKETLLEYITQAETAENYQGMSIKELRALYDYKNEEEKKYKKALDQIKTGKDRTEAVNLLKGRDYPDKNIVDSVIAWGAESLKDTADWRAFQMEQRGMDPNSTSNTIGSIVGNLVPLYASSYLYRSAISRPRVRTVKGVYNVQTQQPKQVIEYPYSRAQIAEKTEKFGKAYTFAQMTGEYTKESVLDYIDRTGDVELAYYKPTTAQTAAAVAYGAIGTLTEYELGGIEPLIAGSFKKAGLKTPLLKATLKTLGQEGAEEYVQYWEDFLARKIDGTSNKTWREAFWESLKGAAYGAVMGGIIGGTTFHVNRRNLIKGIMQYGNGQINEVQATQIADNMLETVEDTMDYAKKSRLEKIRTLVAATYEDVDMPEAEKQDAIDATTRLEYAMIAQWNTLNGTNIEDDPLFKGEVNELGYFRTGIPETQRANIESYLTELRTLKKQLTETTEQLKNARTAEKPDTAQIKELSTKLDELENKIETMESDKYRLERLGQLETEEKRNIRAEMRRREALIKQQKLEERIKAREEKQAADKANREAIRETNRAIAQQKAELEQKRQTLVRHSTTEALRNVLRNRPEWDEATIKVMTRAELKNAVLTLKDIDINTLTQRPVAEQTAEQAQKENKPTKTLTAKKYFHRKINKRFAEESGIRDAWGYNKNDKAVNVVFVTNGGLADWDEIVQELQTDGYMPITYAPTAELTAAQEEEAKRIVMGNVDLNAESNKVSEEVDYLMIAGTDILLANGYTQKQIDNMSIDEIRQALIDLAPKAEAEDISYIEDVPDIEFQNKQRGAYLPFFRFILRSKKMDASTLSHELAHDWFEQYISLAQSGNASKEFMRSWNILEKALGIDPDDVTTIKRASEIFARAYEAWLVNKKDWDKNADLSDPERQEIVKMFQRYQQHLKEIYDNITNPYFQKTWGKVGELKPEIAQWFDKVTETTDIEAQLRSGAITEEEAAQRRFENAISNAVENGKMSAEDKRAVKNAQILNDKSRYEAEGGNKNALQNRLSALAHNIDENNMIINKQYDTHRDMLAVAKAADDFVRTRTEEALDIINGRAPEVDGLFATDLYTALERLANETNDLDLVQELAQSEIATKLAKELGQRVAGFRNFLADGRIDTVSVINSLNKKFTDALTQKGKTELSEAEKAFAEEIKAQDERANKEIDNILKEMECK